MIQDASTVKLQGELRICVRDVVFNRIIRRFRFPNLVCRGAKTALAKLMSQDTVPADYEQNKIWAIYAGTGTTDPLTTDDTLKTPVFKKVCTHPYTVNSPVPGIVTVEMTMETGEGNGSTYTEAGLCSRGTLADPNDPAITGVLLYARRVHAGITKVLGMTIEYQWSLQVQL